MSKKKYFTPTSEESALREDTQTKWSVEDIRNAVTLRTLSTSAYRYLRTKRTIPLPGIPALRRWTRSISCQPGILVEIIELLRQKALVFDEREKVLVLSVDEHR